MRNWPTDFGLMARMTLTMILLGVVYLGFLAFLYWLGIDPTMLMIIAAVMLGIQFFFSDKLVLMTSGAKIVTPEQAPQLHAVVEQLCAEADIPKPKVAIMPTDVPNAFATGRSHRKSVIAVTNGLMQRLDPEEVKAVLAHELSHVKNRDVAVMTLASFISTVAYFIMTSFMFGGGAYGRDRRGAGSMVLVYVAALIVYFVSLLLVRLLSRYRELAADRGSAIITGRPRTLITALTKISGQMQRIPKKDLRAEQGMNQFFIIPAISGRSIAELFSTHPSLERRIRELERMERAMRS
ncbi:zinc metalloprotease HtpX [Methanocella sp. MCL-LM]|uniref:zinc metalloprotease HtpX n=1 Tax=Methanocella sp. MCL-LM TaxID=3412035 RepID=UPI003C74754F